jgi:hypothetical protein
MSLITLKDIPPWEWPPNTDKMILEVLDDDKTAGSERLLAVEMAGDSTVICNELAEALLYIIGNERDSDELRGRAAIALGPALEYAFIDEFEEPDEVPITEQMFHRIQETLYRLYLDETAPQIVRRRILEASVRAPQDWHQNAVQEAYTCDDETWQLTAVFCMQFIRGFEKQILESLSSKDPNILYEAVCGAGNWGIDAAWPRIAAFITEENTEKDLLLSAIESAVQIRPLEATEIISPLLDSADEDIIDVVHEALAMAGAFWDDDDDEEPPTFH